MEAHKGHCGRAPSSRQGSPALAGEDLFVVLVGQPRVGDRRATAQGGCLGRHDLVQPRIEIGVHVGYEG
jgi:hypothetical protein